MFINTNFVFINNEGVNKERADFKHIADIQIWNGIINKVQDIKIMEKNVLLTQMAPHNNSVKIYSMTIRKKKLREKRMLIHCLTC